MVAVVPLFSTQH